MNRSALVLFCALAAGVLAVLLWILEFQHLSLLLWLLVVVAVLWCCAEVAVSLHVLPTPRRRRNVRVTQRARPRRSHSRVILIGALILIAIDVVLRVLGLETNSQLIWFLVVIALLWGCAQVALRLRPEGPEMLARGEDSGEETPDSWVSGRTKPFFERLFPGSTVRSGFYNKGNEEVWDGNEKLPPHPSY